MGTVRWVSVHVIVLLLMAPMVFAEMHSPSFAIPTAVVAGGGGTMSSASFAIHATLGQPGPSDQAASAGYRLESGFWRTLLAIIAKSDINGDGAVDLLDVILALRIATGRDVGEITLQADANGDGRIGIAEAILALRKLSGLSE